MQQRTRKLFVAILASVVSGTLWAAKPGPKPSATVQQINKEAVMQQAPMTIKKELVVPVEEPKPETNAVKLPPKDIKNIKKPVKTPAPALKPEIHQASPAIHEKAVVPQAAIKKVPRNKFENSNAVRQANEARGVKEASEMGAAMRNVIGAPERGDGVNPELGLGGKKGGLTGIDGRPVDETKLPGHGAAGFERPPGTEYLPELPSNRDKAPPSIVGTTTNPRDAMKGAAGDLGDDVWNYLRSLTGRSSSSTPVTRLPGAHSVERTSDGGIIVQSHSRGVTEQVAVRRGPGGRNWVSVWTVRNSDGTGEQTMIVRDDDGKVLSKERWDTEEGTPPVAPITHTGKSGSQEDTKPVVSKGGLSETHDAETYNQGAGKSYYDHSASANPQGPNRVNPGPDGGTPNPQAPRLIPDEEQLVINPDPDNVSGGNRAFNPDAYEQQLREKMEGGHGGSPGQTQ